MIPLPNDVMLQWEEKLMDNGVHEACIWTPIFDVLFERVLEGYVTEGIEKKTKSLIHIPVIATQCSIMWILEGSVEFNIVQQRH